MLATLLMVTLFFINILAVVAMYARSRRKAQRRRCNVDGSSATSGSLRYYGFFHPYCNAGGGGERVLWTAIQTILEQYPNVSVVVYTGDRNATSEEILARAERRFQIKLPRSIEFVFIQSRVLLEARFYPVFTLLLQSLASIIVGMEALLKFVPDVYFDSMGYAFTLPVFRLIGGCETVSYVHYPTISSDMLCAVHTRRPGINNRALITSSPLLSRVKLLYYQAFARIYGWVGCGFCNTVIVNSSWTLGHISEIWNTECELLYPPCSVDELAGIRSTSDPSIEFRIISLAQFRPEKDHLMQLAALKVLQKHITAEEFARIKLVCIGSCRNREDSERVEDLKLQTHFLELTENVEFLIDLDFSHLKQELSRATAAIHTMWNEHFGIAVVECMSAGLVTVAHDSGGPAKDIVLPNCGFLASTPEEYAQALAKILRMSPIHRQEIADAGRRSMQRFTVSKFKQKLLQIVASNIELNLPRPLFE